MLALAFPLTLTGGSAANAQTVWQNPVEECLAGDGGDAVCIGVMAEACREAEGPGNEGPCLGAENAVWLSRIRAAEARLREVEAGVTARAEQRGMGPVGLDAVADSFAAYRSATCAWQVASWEGTGAGIAGIACELDLNARHALWLEEQLR